MGEKRPPKLPTPKHPMPRRETMEVDLSWLEEEDASAGKSDGATTAPKAPARPKGTGFRPVLGGGPRRDTMDVRPEWLEVDEVAPKKPSEPPKGPLRRRSHGAIRPPTLPPAAKSAAKKKLPPPLPREEPADDEKKR